jgi:hypothetical protein
MRIASSSGRRGILAAAALAVTPASAHAAPVTVAGASPDSVLAAEDVREHGSDQLELTLVGPIALGATDFTDRESGDPPLWPDEALLVDEHLPSPDGTTRILAAGAVNAAAASVELTLEGGQVVRFPTVDGSAYQGRQAGLVRFFLGDATVPSDDIDDDPVRVRLLDASGAVIGVVKDPDSERSVRLMRRSAGGALVRMNATVISRLAPLPGAPEHRSEQLCLRTGVNESPDGWDVACQDAEEPMTIGGWRGCGHVPSRLAAPPPDRRERRARAARPPLRGEPADRRPHRLGGILRSAGPPPRPAPPAPRWPRRRTAGSCSCATRAMTSASGSTGSTSTARTAAGRPRTPTRMRCSSIRGAASWPASTRRR